MDPTNGLDSGSITRYFDLLRLRTRPELQEEDCKYDKKKTDLNVASAVTARALGSRA